jgi:rsbT co-antagonist protein RsbR
LASGTGNALARVFSNRSPQILSQWLELQARGNSRLSGPEKLEIERKSRDLIEALRKATEQGASTDINGRAWDPIRELLADFSASRAREGYSSSETASFVFSLKQPLFAVLAEETAGDAKALADAVWHTTELLDKLGVLTIEAYQRTREDVIARQQQELLELSTPVVRLWDNILALPLIGTLDSARTQVVMQNLLDAIVQTRSDFAIIDITGVPVVDTLVAQHLLKTVAAARLMGADCLISGIRPQIAQTIIHLGVDLQDVTTKATLADAFAVALRRSGNMVVPSASRQGSGAR